MYTEKVSDLFPGQHHSCAYQYSIKLLALLEKAATFHSADEILRITGDRASLLGFVSNLPSSGEKQDLIDCIGGQETYFQILLSQARACLLRISRREHYWPN